MKLIKKYLAEFFIIIGSGFFSYDLFNFSSRSFFGGMSGTDKIMMYYYEDSTKIIISIGVVLITTGILIIKNRKNNKNN